MLLIVGSAIVSAYNVQRLHADSRKVDHTHQVIATLESIIEKVRDAESGQRAYIITGNEDYFDPYRGHGRRNRRCRPARRASLTADNPEQQARLPQLREQITARLTTLFANAKLREEQGFEAGARVDQHGRRQDDTWTLCAIRSTRCKTPSSGLLIKRIRRSSANVLHDTAFAAAGYGARAAGNRGVLLDAATKLARSCQGGGREIFDQREQLRTTLASIGDAVIATDAEARVVFINPVAASLTGWSADDAQGKPLKEVLRIINEHTREPAVNPVDRVLAEGVIVGLANHTLLIRKDGVETPIDDSAAPIRDQTGQVTGCVLVFRDISRTQEDGSRDRSPAGPAKSAVRSSSASWPTPR